MITTLENEFLNVKISDRGAEILSAKGNGAEYIWQAQAGFWQKHAPWLFPFCSAFYGNQYTHKGKTYNYPKHGFAKESVFTVEQRSNTEAVFTLCDSEETHKIYPFAFRLSFTYRLVKNKLEIGVEIANLGKEEMITGFGAHPGFCVPLGGTGKYEDWQVETAGEDLPKRIILGEDYFLTGEKEDFPLPLHKLKLSHQLFWHDVILLSGQKAAKLCSDQSERSLTFTFDGLTYLGVWAEYRPDVPFVSLEAWKGLPSPSGVTEELSEKADCFHIPVGGSQKLQLSMLFE